jgi:hypothetical protein
MLFFHACVKPMTSSLFFFHILNNNLVLPIHMKCHHECSKHFHAKRWMETFGKFIFVAGGMNYSVSWEFPPSITTHNCHKFPFLQNIWKGVCLLKDFLNILLTVDTSEISMFWKLSKNPLIFVLQKWRHFYIKKEGVLSVVANGNLTIVNIFICISSCRQPTLFWRQFIMCWKMHHSKDLWVLTA